MDNQTELRKLKNFHSVVEDTLKRHPVTRNSDVTLTWYIIYLYYPNEAMEANGRYWVSVRATNMVREDRVKRARAKIQNEQGKYLPDDPAVREARKITEEAYRLYLNKNPELRTV